MRDVDICDVKKDNLVDIRDVKIDTSKSKEERIASFVEQIKNPNCFICDGIIVKSTFIESETTLEDKIKNYFMSM